MAMAPSQLPQGYILPCPAADLKIVTWGFCRDYGVQLDNTEQLELAYLIRRLIDRKVQNPLIYIVGCSQQSPPMSLLKYKNMTIRTVTYDGMTQYHLWS